MPELPEVETTRRALAPILIHKRVVNVIIRNAKLRWPVTPDLANRLAGKQLRSIERRAKYLLLNFVHGTLLIHLGMSGSLRLCQVSDVIKKHDHIDVIFGQGICLRFHDPRRFGAFLWLTTDPYSHRLLAHLGPEPLDEGWDENDLYQQSLGRRVPIKVFIMDARVVVGVGNIYANEALFMAKISPNIPANQVTQANYRQLTQAIKKVLQAAIQQGGTTLKDFVSGNNKPGYFAQQLQVYGREGEPCKRCATLINRIMIAQRASYYCPICQVK